MSSRSSMSEPPVRRMVFSALMAALIVVGAYVAVPIGPVPIVLQNLFVLLAGLVLSPAWALASVLIYLFLGLIGLPVFAGGGAGLAHLAGPTGGYLLGYVPAVLIVALLSGRRPSAFRDLAAAVSGSLLVYAAGVPWLMAVTGLPLARALAVGVLPFLPGDAVKVAVSVPAARFLRPLVHRQGESR